mgnify:CR=1 FL=1
MNSTTAYLVRKAVPLPPRTIPNAGPRQTKYPLDDMEAGDSFAIPVDNEKQARQRQSQFSALAKSRGIKVSTRFFPTDNAYTAGLGCAAPCLGVWHMGEADEAEAETAEAEHVDVGTSESAELEL